MPSATALCTDGGGPRDFAVRAARDERARASSAVASSTTRAARAGTRPAGSQARCSRAPSCHCAPGCWRCTCWPSTTTNMAALELMRHLGVNYRTAWRMKHKIMQVMAERDATRRLSGFVQIDDAYLGGERNGGRGWARIAEQATVPDCGADRCQPHGAELCGDRAGAQLRQCRAHGLDRPSPEARMRCLHRRVGLFRPPGRRRPCTHHTGHGRRTRSHRGRRRPLGQRGALAISRAPSAASITPSRKANMHDGIWPRPPTASTAASACARCCHDWPRR